VDDSRQWPLGTERDHSARVEPAVCV
jgi:hypothetical protein